MYAGGTILCESPILDENVKKVLTNKYLVHKIALCIFLRRKHMEQILEIAEKYGVSLSESDLAAANERWDDGQQTIIVASGRLY